MHKEIEEARAWSNARPSEFAVHDFKRWCLKGTIHARRLLFLFDRMQQEPGILFTEHFIGGKWVPENGTMNPQMGGDKKRIARYRRELEDK